MNIIRDLSVCEYAEMGIKPNKAHTGVQVPELHVSEVVFASDNHNNKIFLLSLGTDSLFGSSCGTVSFIQVLEMVLNIISPISYSLEIL